MYSNTSLDYSFIGDTNFYRNLSYNDNGQLKTIHEIKDFFCNLGKSESKNGHSSYCNPFVLLELFSHLADENDSSFEVCRRAVVGIFEHCRMGDNLKLIADSELQMSKTLFNRAPEGNLETTEKLSILAKKIYKNPSSTNIITFKPILEEISTKIRQSEKYFIDDFREFILKDLNPDKVSWKPLKDNKEKRKRFLKALNSRQIKKSVAKAFVIKAALLVNKNIDIGDQEIERKIDYILTYYQTPIELFIEILRRISTSGLDLTKKNRENYIWDLQIVFSIAKDHIINNRIPVLVTEDKDILKAANKVNCSNQCINIQQYLELIEKNKN